MNASGSFIGLLATLTLVPFIILNFLAGIVGGIWLILLGKWVLVVASVVAVFIVPTLIAIVLMPTMALALLINYLNERRKFFLMSVVAWINLSITQSVLVAWSFIVFLAMLVSSQEMNILPHLLLGYAVATGPVASMAQREGRDAIGSHIGAWLVQVSYVIFVTFYLLGIFPLALWVVLALALIIAWYLVKATNVIARAEQQYKEMN